MRGRIHALLATAIVALAAGAPLPAARAAEQPVTRVGGGGFGVLVINPGGATIHPTPDVIIPDDGTPPEGYYAYSDAQFPGFGFENSRMSVYAFATTNPGPDEPYVFVDSRVATVSIAGIPELTFMGVKTFCEWDQLGGDNQDQNQAFGATLLYYEGNVGGAPVVVKNAGENVALPGGGHYIINEQKLETLPDGRQVITVNGVHAWLADGTEYIVASSICDPLRPPVFGNIPADSRDMVGPATAGLVDGWNNAAVNEDCNNGVDDNGNGIDDAHDPACGGGLPDCEEDGFDHFFGAGAAEGAVSAYVHYIVEPAVRRTGVVPGEPLLHSVNCAVIVPVEDATDTALWDLGL